MPVSNKKHPRLHALWGAALFLPLCILPAAAPHAAAAKAPAGKSTAPKATPATPPTIVARLPNRTVSLEEVDAAGGANLAEAAQQLYALRTRALFQLLADDVLAREAKRQQMSVDALLDKNAKLQAVSDADVDRLLAGRTGINPQDPATREQAMQYLNLRARASAKRSYVMQLFTQYQVRIALAPPPETPAEEVRGAVEPVLGPADAPVTVVSFSDYECPYCRQFSHTLDQLRERFPKEVRVIYRHFPGHKDSDHLAQAALCAADQGQFETYQRELFAATESVDAEALAQKLNLDVNRFSDCLASRAHAARVSADRAEGDRLQIAGTPTVFVNGVRLRGAQPLERLSAAVQAALQTTARLSAQETHENKRLDPQLSRSPERVNQ
jgi:protein-disulfide isomerase